MKAATMISAAVIALGAWGLVSLFSDGAESPRHTANQLFMRQKMAWSQAALEGITLEKFDLVSKNAIRMRDMTFSNMWFTMKNPDYLRHTTNFHKNAESLYLAAVDKNLEAATEAYGKVVRDCVDCHRMVRIEQRKTALPAAAPARGSGKP